MQQIAVAEALCLELGRLGERALAVDTRNFERAAAGEVRAALVPELLRLLTESSESLSRVLDWCDASLSPGEGMGAAHAPSGTERALDDLMASRPSVQALSDVAFVARLDLRQKQVELEKAANGPGDDAHLVRLVGGCASVRRRVLKTLSATEQSLATLVGRSSTLGSHFASQLAVSLAVRDAYRRLARTFGQPDEAPEEETLKAALEAAGNALATLGAEPLWQDLRIEDRVALSGLHERVETWLRDSTKYLDGLHLWQDLAAAASALLLVNNRAMLRDHDLLVARSLRSLAGGDPKAAAPAEVLVRMRALAGRDESVASLAEREPPPTAGELVHALEAIEATLAPSIPPASGPDPFAEPG